MTEQLTEHLNITLNNVCLEGETSCNIFKKIVNFSTQSI